MPNFALNAAPIFSDTDRSIEVYHTTLLSFFAASISCGVIASAGGAPARPQVASMLPAAGTAEPFNRSRLLILLFIAVSSRLLLSGQRAAPRRRQRQPDFAAPRNRIIGFGDDSERGAVGGLHHVVAVGAEKHLP